MPQDKTNFDDYLEHKQADVEFNKRFEAANQTWDAALVLTRHQILSLFAQLNPLSKREVLYQLAETADSERATHRTVAAAALQKRAAECGADWTQMSESEREAFIDDLVHKDR